MDKRLAGLLGAAAALTAVGGEERCSRGVLSKNRARKTTAAIDFVTWGVTQKSLSVARRHVTVASTNGRHPAIALER